MSTYPASDQVALALIAATRELQTIEILADHMVISDVALDRIHEALDVIRGALNLERSVVGLPVRAERAAA